MNESIAEVDAYVEGKRKAADTYYDEKVADADKYYDDKKAEKHILSDIYELQQYSDALHSVLTRYI